MAEFIVKIPFWITEQGQTREFKEGDAVSASALPYNLNDLIREGHVEQGTRLEPPAPTFRRNAPKDDE